jgi:hypothetical protein
MINYLTFRGNGSYYRLGHGEDSDVLEPKEVEALKKKRITYISCGMYHNLCNTGYLIKIKVFLVYNSKYIISQWRNLCLGKRLIWSFRIIRFK